jgi:hypothetical protein
MPKRYLFKARCASCESELWRPHGGDHEYGTGIFFGVEGTVFAVVDFLETHRDVARLIDDLLVSESLVTRDMFSLCATLADPIEGQNLIGHPVCSHCGSVGFSSWGGESRNTVEVPYATFSGFLRLTPEERRAELHRALRERPSVRPGGAWV